MGTSGTKNLKKKKGLFLNITTSTWELFIKMKKKGAKWISTKKEARKLTVPGVLPEPNMDWTIENSLFLSIYSL